MKTSKKASISTVKKRLSCARISQMAGLPSLAGRTDSTD